MAALKPGEVDLGTTIMAVSFDGGVVVGADSRTSTGTYVANRVTDKLTKVDERIYCCRSGSAADTQAVADIVKYHLDLYSSQHGEMPTVKVASSLFQELCYHNKNNLMASIIVAGWDKQNGGSVYEVPLGGSLHKCEFSVAGSGSSYIFGYCDKVFRPNMSKEECIEFVKNAVGLAITRDGSSGGVIRIATITEDGVERQVVYGNQLPAQYTG
ncbi:Proteasome subunit beta type-1 [Coemansia sp. RSA 989]|nr:proteasome subunit beta type-6 [Coemansia mojavensis]KAJ1742083.1 Proteasome subunit beta type-1 [Coemansia sp. RSA 1086]KAJ1750304.1 Proteasome subunit beta type-1 [Coemansia sp. RSA 1821]KAJ1866146.1 Proteasome subunit beta type-1 [Coemansia sp. RSA 989]KAJ1873400.1 Proteasome subunit beta type-1 [Coemansia sp. RSA 990]KAJ2629437.1 Proteasome subunit beta type-1 [Coemansia sp. RSA 1290]KAJ2648981.1 Proteasome subunit beta type-1 [Coemansia sp. RSA 1250]KAJ2671346.1 Proteasome subunit be